MIKFFKESDEWLNELLKKMNDWVIKESDEWWVHFDYEWCKDDGEIARKSFMAARFEEVKKNEQKPI